jgi:hypothetical protein
VVQQLGALLTPIAGPVATGGAVAVEAGKDIEGLGSGHVVLLECRLIGVVTDWRPLRDSSPSDYDSITARPGDTSAVARPPHPRPG